MDGEDAETSAVSQGETREASTANLDEAIAGVTGEAGHESTDEELHELGLDRAEDRSGGELPDVLE